MKINCAYDEIVELHKITPCPKNPNRHTDDQVERLAKIIDYQGQRSPIVISNRSGFIVSKSVRTRSDLDKKALELELGAYILKNGSLQLGTVGTAITKWSDVAQCGSFLSDLGLNTGRKYAIMDPWAAQALADKQGALGSANVELIRSAWEDAQIAGNFAGVRALMSNALSNRTAGTAAGVCLVVDTTAGTGTTIAAGDLVPACGVTLEAEASGVADCIVYKNF